MDWKKAVLGALVLLVVATVLPAAQTVPKLNVVTTLFPLYDFARNVGGERAEVTLLLPPGMEAHHYEPKPSDIVKTNSAALFIFTGNFMEPWVPDFLRGITNKGLLVVNASKGITLQGDAGHDEEGAHGHAHGEEEHGGKDPHIWLDFDNAQKMVNNIRDGFIGKDPGHREYYTRNAAAYNAKLAQLDKRYRETLSQCKQNTLVYGGHLAFGYMARRYQLRVISVYRGFSSDVEPTPQDLLKLSRFLEQNRIRYVFYERLSSPRVAQAIAQEAGAELMPLYSAHNVTREERNKGVGFLELMEEDLNYLKKGLQCR